MSLAKKCDRCGKLYEHYPIDKISGNYNAIRFVRMDISGVVDIEKKPMDLCPECMSSFDSWFRHVENVECCTVL